MGIVFWATLYTYNKNNIKEISLHVRESLCVEMSQYALNIIKLIVFELINNLDNVLKQLN